MKKIKFFLFILIFIVLLLPVLQKIYPIIKLNQLGGAFTPMEKPVFSTADWFSEKYQQQYNKYLEENIGFREFFVRLHNTIEFYIYNKANAEGTIVGKKGYLFEEDYILEYIGRHFIGKNTINKKLERIKFLQQELKSKKNIDLVVVFEPGKASFYPEYIPDAYNPQQKTISNYDYYTQRCNELGIKYIDFNRYFKSLKKTSEYPLFPKYGIHWSEYGAILASDSLIKYIEKTRNIDLPEMNWSKIDVSRKFRGIDYDMGNAMNLLWELPHSPMAYPEVKFINKPHQTKPSVLVIGDSFYFSIMGYKIPDNVFNNASFWYYNSKIYPDSYFSPKTVEQINLKEEVEKRDVVFLMITERFLYTAFWNFSDNLYKLYCPNYTEDLIYDQENGIRLYTVWFKNMIKQAKTNNRSLEEEIRLNAEYTFTENYNKTTQHTKAEWLTYYKLKILNDQSKKEQLEQQAKKLKISLDEVLNKELEKKYNEEVLAKK